MSGRIRTLVVWPGSLLILLAGQSTHAQVTPFIDPTGRSHEPPRPREEKLEAPRPAPGIALPPVPLLPREKAGIPSARSFIREVRVTGSTVFSAEEFARVTARFTGREVSTEDLEALRTELTLLYVSNGFVNSGAILPDQTIVDGVVTFQVIEGRLSGIEIRGTRWFHPTYLAKRISPGAKPPLNLDAVQERLRLLLEDQRIARLNAELRPGLKPGDGLLDVLVEERVPYRLWLDLNNHQSPSVGEKRWLIAGEHQNLTGNGDVASARYGRSTGLDPLLDLRYSLPLTAHDTTLAFQYRKNAAAVVEAPFNEIDVKSSRTFTRFR